MYLNKGQTYTLTVVDSKPPIPMKGVEPLEYRMFVRVSFEEQDQRSNQLHHGSYGKKVEALTKLISAIASFWPSSMSNPLSTVLAARRTARFGLKRHLWMDFVSPGQLVQT